MESWQFIFFATSIILMVGRVVYDNMSIAQNYSKMSVKISDTVAVTPETINGFRGFFKWCSRTHYFMVYMALSHSLFWLVYPEIGSGVVVLGELFVMMAIHYPQREFTQVVLDRFFDIDLKAMEELVS